MSVPMVFVISMPRSGSTMLERMLECHSMILGGPEPHILTPLAHLGVWAKVDKAPYDHILAADAQRLFVEKLPRGEQDYWAACRAYCDALYGRYLATSTKTLCLDKTPAYALILPFMMKVFPDAKYVVLTRHPIATFSSYANSFFDGDYRLAQNHNPILNRYVPAMAQFLRQKEVSFIHVRYEDLVQEPEAWMEKIYAYIGVPFERETIDYGERDVNNRKGLGDPIGVQQHIRPSSASINKWAAELAAEPAKLEFVRGILAEIAPEDLRTLGYPPETLWQPMEEVRGKPVSPAKPRMTRYRLQRKMIIELRRIARKGGLFRKTLRTVQLACDVLLRE